MRKLSAVTAFLIPLAYLLTAATVGALIAYPIDRLLLHGAFTLYKVINRCTLTLMLLGIIPMVRWLQLQRNDFGLAKSPSLFALQFVRGFGYGIVILGVIATCIIALDIRIVQFDRLLSLSKVLHELSLAIIVSLVVGTLEETLFRGFMFGALLKYSTPLRAMIVTGLFYAALHFMRSNLAIPTDQLDWSSGLSVVLDALRQLFRPANIDSFIALFLASLFLTCVRLFIRDSLAYCIGLHAGWVFTIKLTKAFTELHPAAEWGALVGSYDGLIGYLSSAWLVLLITGFVWTMRPRLC